MTPKQRLGVYKSIRKSLKNDRFPDRSWRYSGFCVFLYLHKLPAIYDLPELFNLRPEKTINGGYWLPSGFARPRLRLIEKSIEDVKEKIWYYRAWRIIKNYEI